MAAAIACIGAAHVDHIAHARGAVTFGTSNPVTMRHGAGGVARNVAESLARLGVKVKLVSRVGADRQGSRIIDQVAALGVDIGLVQRSGELPTASYTALIDAGGRMVVAMADMGIYDEMTPAALEPALPALAECGVWFLDANLPAPTLRHLLAVRPTGVLAAVDTVSVPKAVKLAELLGGIDLLFANRDEAALLSGLPIKAPLDVFAGAYRLLGHGIGTVVVGMGPTGAFVCDAATAEFVPAIDGAMQDETGAGDALIAGMLWGRADGRPIGPSLRLGAACAAFAIESEQAVNPALTAAGLLARAGLGA